MTVTFVICQLDSILQPLDGQLSKILVVYTCVALTSQLSLSVHHCSHTMCFAVSPTALIFKSITLKVRLHFQIGFNFLVLNPLPPFEFFLSQTHPSKTISEFSIFISNFLSHKKILKPHKFNLSIFFRRFKCYKIYLFLCID